MPIRVFIVDDHAMVRGGLRLQLQQAGDIEVVGEAGSGEEALPAIRRLQPDVVLCDLHMPGMSGMEVTERIARTQADPRVIIVSVLEDGPMPRRLLDCGASGYVPKACDRDELVRAVRQVAAGRRYIAASVAQAIALAGLERSDSPFDRLTDRELEVALLLNQGMRQTAIARRLNLSAKTVHTHKSRLFEKLAIHDTIALSRMVAQYGVGDPSAAGAAS